MPSATVNAAGLITALSAGTSNIGVSAGGQSANFALSVDANVSTSVQVVPANLGGGVGATLQLTGTDVTALGNPGRNKTLVWSSSDATKATVNQSGLALGRRDIERSFDSRSSGRCADVKGCVTLVVQ